MDDLISRSELKMCIRDLAKTIARANGGVDDVTVALKEVYDMVGEAPTIDAEPVRHGRWVQEDDDMWVCSACGNAWTFIVDGPTENGAYYCPHCGTKMDGGDPHD